MGKNGHNIVVEGKARIAVPKHSGRVVSSAMPVFYNPVMKSNRDITVLLLAAAAKMYCVKKWRIADPMAATGVRGIRLLLEIGKLVELVAMNDHSSAAAGLVRKNLRQNRISEGKKVAVTKNEANKFLLNNSLFSYIDIDPFGYPGIFLDAAVKRIRHNGIMAVTATDTSALAGAAQAACQRKYLATPLKNGFMHETGVRILIRLAQLIGAMHGKALIPVFSYYKDHYIRAFFLCKEGAGKADRLLKMHKEIAYCSGCCEKKIGESEITIRCSNCRKQMLKAGPLWVGNLFDKELAFKIVAAAANPNRAKSSIGPRRKSSEARLRIPPLAELRRNGDVGNNYVGEKTKAFIKVIAEEAKWEEKCGIGFYTIEDICERHKIGQQPKTADVIRMLRQKGYAASPTHCSTTGVKTNASVKGLLSVIWH